MLGAYNCAFVRPIQKLYYNLMITAVSVVVAVVIGSHDLHPGRRHRVTPVR
jgi:nickel/cobalt transporter (NiCoT) family protein